MVLRARRPQAKWRDDSPTNSRCDGPSLHFVEDFSHWIFIDEAGSGSEPRVGVSPGLNTGYVAAAIGIAPSRLETAQHWLEWLRAWHIKGDEELKASNLPGSLKAATTLNALARDLGRAMAELEADVWCTATFGGVRPPQNFPTDCTTAKEIARRFLIERLDGFVRSRRDDRTKAILVWDLSERRDLSDFSASVNRFTNSFSGAPRSVRLAPCALGALSHEWPCLQMADVVANLALHALGASKNWKYSSPEKARAFHAHIVPRLKQASDGSRVGYKIWWG